MSLTLTDAASTPVNRAFTAVSSDPTLTVWKSYTANGALAIGADVASLSVRENGTTIRVSGKLVLPVLETVAGDSESGFTPPPTKAFEELSTFEFVFPIRASLQNRKDIRSMLLDFLGDAIVTAAIENFVHPSAAS